MIKTVDLVWEEEYGNLISQPFLFGWFKIDFRDGVYFCPNTEDDYFFDHLALFKNRPDNYTVEGCPIIETIEEAKQACQDYLQQIAEEIVKC